MRMVEIDDVLIERVVGICYYPHQKPRPGDFFTFERDRFNEKDKFAIAVYDKDEVQVGHLNRHCAYHFAKLMDAGKVRLLGEYVQDVMYKSPYTQKDTPAYQIVLWVSSNKIF